MDVLALNRKRTVNHGGFGADEIRNVALNRYPDRDARRLYDALARKDGKAMAACYAPGVRFSDPVFPDLEGEEAADMWRLDEVAKLYERCGWTVDEIGAWFGEFMARRVQ